MSNLSQRRTASAGKFLQV